MASYLTGFQFTVYRVSLIVMAVFYFVAGVMHFLRPSFYLKIVPPYLPFPLPLVYVSGFAESALAIMLLFPAVRPLAAWGVVALLVAVFPANWYMYQRGGAAFGMPHWMLVVRLPLQLGLMAWAYCYT